MSAIELLSELRRKQVRLSVVDGQLRSSAPVGVLDAPLRARIGACKAELTALLAQLGANDWSIEGSGAGTAPLSFGQARLWFLQGLEPGNPGFNVPLALRLRGPLDVAALQAGFDAIVARHAVLRSAFVLDGEQPCQRVVPGQRCRFSVLDLGALPPQERAAAAAEAERRNALTPFAFEQPSLLRVLLVKLSAHERLLSMCWHHMVCDGWSFAILMTELEQLYHAHQHHEPPVLAPLRLQYADFARWQQQRADAPAVRAQLDYWSRALAGAPTTLALPGTPGQCFRGALARFTIGPELAGQLRAYARPRGATLFAVLLCAYYLMLAHRSGQHDILIGTDFSIRHHLDTEQLIGFFINRAALRVRAGAQDDVDQTVARVTRTTLEAAANQDVPFERVVRALAPARVGMRHPLFQCMFGLHNNPHAAPRLSQLEAELLPQQGSGTWMLDLSLYLTENASGFAGELNYDAARLDALFVQELGTDFNIALECVCRGGQTVGTVLAALDAAARARQMEHGRQFAALRQQRWRGAVSGASA